MKFVAVLLIRFALAVADECASVIFSRYVINVHRAFGNLSDQQTAFMSFMSDAKNMVICERRETRRIFISSMMAAIEGGKDYFQDNNDMQDDDKTMAISRITERQPSSLLALKECISTEWNFGASVGVQISFGKFYEYLVISHINSLLFSKLSLIMEKPLKSTSFVSWKNQLSKQISMDKMLSRDPFDKSSKLYQITGYHHSTLERRPLVLSALIMIQLNNEPACYISSILKHLRTDKNEQDLSDDLIGLSCACKRNKHIDWSFIRFDLAVHKGSSIFMQIWEQAQLDSAIRVPFASLGTFLKKPLELQSLLTLGSSKKRLFWIKLKNDKFVRVDKLTLSTIISLLNQSQVKIESLIKLLELFAPGVVIIRKDDFISISCIVFGSKRVKALFIKNEKLNHREFNWFHEFLAIFGIDDKTTGAPLNTKNAGNLVYFYDFKGLAYDVIPKNDQNSFWALYHDDKQPSTDDFAKTHGSANLIPNYGGFIERLFFDALLSDFYEEIIYPLLQPSSGKHQILFIISVLSSKYPQITDKSIANQVFSVITALKKIKRRKISKHDALAVLDAFLTLQSLEKCSCGALINTVSFINRTLKGLVGNNLFNEKCKEIPLQFFKGQINLHFIFDSFEDDEMASHGDLMQLFSSCFQDFHDFDGIFESDLQNLMQSAILILKNAQKSDIIPELMEKIINQSVKDFDETIFTLWTMTLRYFMNHDVTVRQLAEFSIASRLLFYDNKSFQKRQKKNLVTSILNNLLLLSKSKEETGNLNLEFASLKFNNLEIESNELFRLKLCDFCYLKDLQNYDEFHLLIDGTLIKIPHDKIKSFCRMIVHSFHIPVHVLNSDIFAFLSLFEGLKLQKLGYFLYSFFRVGNRNVRLLFEDAPDSYPASCMNLERICQMLVALNISFDSIMTVGKYKAESKDEVTIKGNEEKGENDYNDFIASLMDRNASQKVIYKLLKGNHDIVIFSAYKASVLKSAEWEIFFKPIEHAPITVFKYILKETKNITDSFMDFITEQIDEDDICDCFLEILARTVENYFKIKLLNEAIENLNAEALISFLFLFVKSMARKQFVTSESSSFGSKSRLLFDFLIKRDTMATTNQFAQISSVCDYFLEKATRANPVSSLNRPRPFRFTYYNDKELEGNIRSLFDAIKSSLSKSITDHLEGVDWFKFPYFDFAKETMSVLHFWTPSFICQPIDLIDEAEILVPAVIDYQLSLLKMLDNSSSIFAAVKVLLKDMKENCICDPKNFTSVALIHIGKILLFVKSIASQLFCIEMESRFTLLNEVKSALIVKQIISLSVLELQELEISIEAKEVSLWLLHFVGELFLMNLALISSPSKSFSWPNSPEEIEQSESLEKLTTGSKLDRKSILTLSFIAKKNRNVNSKSINRLISNLPFIKKVHGSLTIFSSCHGSFYILFNSSPFEYISRLEKKYLRQFLQIALQ